MTPLQVAKLAIQWYEANKADIEETVRHTAESYRFTEEETAHALDLARQQLARRNALGYWPAWPV